MTDRRRAARAFRLPLYVPPRFADDIYIHAEVEGPEDAHGCIIRFVGAGTQYPANLEGRIDGAPPAAWVGIATTVATPVYEMSATEFREAVGDALDADDGGGAPN